MHEVSFGLNWAVWMGGGQTLPLLAMSEVLPPHLSHFWSTIKNQHFLPGGLLGFTSLSFCPLRLRSHGLIHGNSAFFCVLVAEGSL